MNEKELRELEVFYRDIQGDENGIVPKLIAEIHRLKKEREEILHELWYIQPRFARERFGYVPENNMTQNLERMD